MILFLRKLTTSKSFLAVFLILVSGFVFALGLRVKKGEVVDTTPAEATRGYPQAVYQLLNEAETAEKNSRTPEAVSAYEKIIAAQPDFAEAYFRLGIVYFHAGLPTKSEEFYQKAIEKGFQSPEVYFHLGYIKENGGDLNKALEYYLKSEAGLSRNPALFYNIGNVYARLDKKDEAIEYYNRAVNLNPGHMDAFINLSIMSFHKDEYADAQFYLEKAVKLGYQAPREYIDALSQKLSYK